MESATVVGATSTVAVDAATPTVAVDGPAPTSTFAPQQAVLIGGLSGRAELNGLVAEVLGLTHNGRYPVKVLPGGECVRVKPESLSRTDQHPLEGKVVNGYVMRYGEWFAIQHLLDQTMNNGEAAGDVFAALQAHEQADVLAGRRAIERPVEASPDYPSREVVGAESGACDADG